MKFRKEIYANGVNPYDPRICCEQILAVREYYGKTPMSPLIHFIIEYDKFGTPDLETACWCTRKIASFYQDEYQTLQCTHMKDEDYSWFHAHILVNTVSFVDGKMFNTTSSELNKFNKWVTEITQTKSHIELWNPQIDEIYRKRKIE